MLQEIKEYVDQHHMLSYKDKVVVGVSGGADSVCLFFVLLEWKKQYGLSMVAVHVNHQIRGKDGDKDETFVRDMCSMYQVPCEIVTEDVISAAQKQGISVEEAGRRIRYGVFEKIRRRYGYNKIAVAHNRNDQSETVLLNLFRGSGLRGIAGISPVRGNIIRPLLATGRSEIEHYLKDNNISYCTDATNLMDHYTRNKIRLHVIPYITEHINGKTIEHIAKTAGMLRKYEEYIERNTLLSFQRVVSTENGQYFISVEGMKKEDPVIRDEVIRLVLEKMAGGLKDIESGHVDQIAGLIEKQPGKRIDLPYSIQAVREYVHIRFCMKQSPVPPAHTYSIEIPVPGEILISQSGMRVSFELVSAEYKKNRTIPKNDYTKWFDYDKIKNTVFLRYRQPGDFIQIDVQGNTKKLKSYFIDQKIPREERGRTPLLADGSHIIWVLGGRISEAYKVNENTKNILIVQINGGNMDVRHN